MNPKVKLALVGRPNVGKSALFNRICKKKIAIVDEAEGITRDRLYTEADFFGHTFQLIDTGGIHPNSEVPFQKEIRQQSEIAIEEADVIVMVVDAHSGITLLDDIVAKILHRTNKRVVLAVNKIDNHDQMELIYPFYALGFKEVVGVSAVQGFQIAELLEAAFKGRDWKKDEDEANGAVRVAIIGRPNVGKSTIVNTILDEDRCVVSPIAGTTRDSIDIAIEHEGTPMILIDTAGIRRKKAEHEVVDKFAAIRTQRAIERSDVCVLVMDSVFGMTTQEKRIAEEIEAQGKACVLVFNKWDLVQGYRMEHCLKSIRIEASFLNYCPVLFISAQEHRNLDQLFPLIKEVYEQRGMRVTTGQLNKFIERVLQKYHPPMIQGKRLRIYYMAQVATHPPRFVVFVNFPELMIESYKKYMINQFREEYSFKGVPLVFDLRGKHQREEEHPQEVSGGMKISSQPKAQRVDLKEDTDDFDLDAMPDLQEDESLDPSYFS
ncbi:MAG: ribosome biogenesis GTPase Der [Chlamydiae bacterium]|nr:ribosome biogenesis GTPase Der [Chlamydiota bacterium]